MRLLPLLLLLAVPARAELSTEAAAQDPMWLRLLHYAPGVFGGMRSTIDDATWFFAETGRDDPRAELAATLAAMREGREIDGMHAVCAYPARAAWIAANVEGAALPEVACPRFETWRERMNAGALSVIFASAYLDNPASMYGHTFLRLDNKEHDDAKRLLDYTVNYYAETDTMSGLAFAWNSIVGGYAGRFSTLPYYMKVQEYNNIETRDIWEYRLNVPPEGVERLVRHLWEIGRARPTYYFINRNCSYHLLPLLDVAAPGLDLAARFRSRAIPVDTLRALTEVPGLVERVEYRPSHEKKMRARRSLLGPAERALAKDLASAPSPLEIAGFAALGAEDQARVLDSAYDLFRYRIGFNPRQPDPVARRDAALLAHRAKLTPKPQALPGIARGENPERGHASSRFAAGFGADKKGALTTFEFRPALHDTLDDARGFLRGSRLEMATLRLRWEHEPQELVFEDLTGVDILSLAPWDAWSRPKSWKFRFGFGVQRDLAPLRGAAHAKAFGATFGFGRAYDLGPALVYALSDFDAALGAPFRDWYRFGAGAEGGVVVDAVPGLAVHLSARYVRYFLGDPRGRVVFTGGLGWSPLKRWTLRAQALRDAGHQEGRLSLGYFF